MKFVDWAVEKFARLCVWAGSDEYRRNMKDLGWGK